MEDYFEEDGLDNDRKPLDESPKQQELLRPNMDDVTIEGESLKMCDDLEKILGDDPHKAKREVNLHPTLVTRWKDWIVTGLSKSVVKELTDKYPRTGNCNFEAPALNPEVMHSLKEIALKRDKHFVHSQNLAGTALSAIGMAITSLLREDSIDKLKLLEQLSDTAKLLIQVHHKESCARIAYILPGMSKQIKAVLEETKPDSLLFGHGLTEKLQDAIALEKLGKEMKAHQDTQLSTSKPNKPYVKPGSGPKWKNNPGNYVDARSKPGPHRNNYQQRPKKTHPYQQSSVRQQQHQQNNPPRKHNAHRYPNHRPPGNTHQLDRRNQYTDGPRTEPYRRS